MFAGSGGPIGTPTSSPRRVSAVGCNINARNKNGLFSNHSLGTFSRLWDSTTRVLEKLPQSQQRLFKDLSDLPRRPWPIAFVSADVQAFVDDFLTGANASDPSAAIRALADEGREFARGWLAVPIEQRVFVAGSGEDTQHIRAAANALSDCGYYVFFYDFCRDSRNTLCDSEVVGAYCATAGMALVTDSPASSRSRYVLYEIDAARSVMRGTRVAVLITPRDVIRAGTGAAVGATIVSLDEPAPR